MKIRRWLAAAAALTSLTLSSCVLPPGSEYYVGPRLSASGLLPKSYVALPKLTVLHTPMQPTNSQAVTYTATAHAQWGISVIQIWRRSFVWDQACGNVGGLCVSGATLRVTLIKTCNFLSRPRDTDCRVVDGPYADGSFITYGATMKDSLGNAAEDRWIGFAAGAGPTSNNPIPIYVRGDRATSVDIMFVPDTDYGGNNAQFIVDVERLVTQGYFATSTVSDSRDRWNFYVTYTPGVVAGYLTNPPPGTPSCQITVPNNWLTLASTADTAAYVHTRTLGSDSQPFRDCTPGVTSGPTNFMITANSNASTVVHETGHAVFALSDEYCCDGAIVTTAWPHPNMFASQSDCQTSAVAHAVPVANCVQLTVQLTPTVRFFCGALLPAPVGSPPGTIGPPVLGGTNNQWVQDADSDLMGCGANSGGAAGTLDESRINWYYDHL